MKNYHVWNPATDVEELSRMIDMGPLCIARGEGAYLYNRTGERYINALGSLWNVAVGHGRKELCRAAAEQMEILAFSSSHEQISEPAIRLADKLCEMTDGNYDMVFFGSNGTDATETAIKIARQFFRQHPDSLLREKYKIISFEGCYHGSSYAAMSAQSDPGEAERYGPLIPGFIKITPPSAFHNAYDSADQAECEKRCLREVEKLLSRERAETIAAFIAEPVMGLAGIIPFSDDFFNALIALLHNHNILFIADEVSTGFGRTGRMFVSEAWRERPDMMCLSKGISSGYLPLSAVLATKEVFENFKGKGRQLEHSYTASGHPVCCAVALRNIQIIEEERLCENAAETGAFLREKIAGLREKRPVLGDVRGRGLMIGMELTDPESGKPLSDEETFKIAADCIMMGVLLFYRKNILALFPPLIIDRGVAEEICAVLSAALDISKSGLRKRRMRMMKTISDNLLNRNKPK